MDREMLLIILCLPVGLLVFLLFDHLTQSKNDYKERIEQDLKKHNCVFVDIELPGLFKSGPFPFVKLNMFRQRSGITFLKGFKTRYRIVTYKTSSGVLKKAWAKIEIKSFQVDDIEWRPSINFD